MSRIALATFAATSLCAFIALPAHSQLTVTLQDSLISSVVPSSGSTFVTFNGTVTVDPGFDVDARTFDGPFTTAFDTLPLIFTPNFDAYYLPFNPGATYIGDIFQIEIPAGTTPGDYLFGLNGIDPASVTLRSTGLDGGGNVVSDFASDTFGVQATAVTVPEHGSLSLGLAAAGVVASVRRKRRAG